MIRGSGAAVMLPERDRQDLAVQALSRSATIIDLAARHGVSRQFVYRQTGKARVVLDGAFGSASPDNSSYLGVVEFMRDLLGVSTSMGTIHQVLHSAARQAGSINRCLELSGIRVGLQDELFHGAAPVLAGVDAASTYCYLLAEAERRDADTWGVHLLDAGKQGLKPDYTIADAGQGLRAGQKAAWDDTPCHGDVFHIQHQCEALANTLSRLAKGAKSRRLKLETRSPEQARAMQRTSLPHSWGWRATPKPKRIGWPGMSGRWTSVGALRRGRQRVVDEVGGISRSFGRPDAAQAQRRSPSSHSEDEVPSSELAGV
jgi:hypothetical protein